MASQDNPEQGLCHNPSAERPVTPVNNALKPTRIPLSEVKISTARKDSRRKSGQAQKPKTTNGSDEQGSTQKETQVERVSSKDENLVEKMGSDLSVLEEPANMDHRSFVQNVFGTVAFKMLEWLTPRNLELLVKSQEANVVSSEAPAAKREASSTDQDTKGSPINDGRKTDDKKGRRSSRALTDRESKAREDKSAPTKPSTEEQQAASVSPPPKLTVDQEAKPQPLAPSRRRTNSGSIQRPGPNARKKPEPIDPPCPKGILNKSPKIPETAHGPTPFPPGSFGSLPKRRMSRQTLITSPKMHVSEPAPSLHELEYVPVTSIPESKEPPISKNDEGLGREVDSNESQPHVEPIPKQSPIPPIRDIVLPQSLSRLSIETIELLCDIIQLDGTSEKHFLQPYEIGKDLKRRRDHEVPLRRSSSVQSNSGYPTSSKQQWHSFVEQSFFDVLSKPDSLLKSFRDEQDRLFDTQTIWYLMLRMIRVAPSLVFDSLWNVTGTLFRPPQNLEAAHDWATDSDEHKSLSSASVSNQDAAQAINICLHALVAAAPLVSDARQLANMSRIRSYGLAMLGRESSSLEPATLCLQYEDAFTNELALRLARRVFSAIRTRRRFAELFELQNNVRADGKQEPDVLETILGTLKFLDLGTPPILNFPDSERDLHEKRVPTVILDWARTVMLQDWSGGAEVPSDGPFGGALATMAAICKFHPILPPNTD
jgi:hypothetical protein